MKKLSDPGKYVLTAIVLIVFALLCATYAKNRSGVELRKDYAIIYPRAHWGGNNCDELNQILQKYDKSLYKIQTYDKGKLVKAEGDLDESVIRHGLISEVTKEAEQMKFTGCAIQAGKMSDEGEGKRSPRPRPSPTVSPTPSIYPSASPGGSTTRQNLIPEVGKLAKKIQPVLDKYNKK